MPSIEIKTSQELFDWIGRENRKIIGDELRETLAEYIDMDSATIVAYWYPWADAQNPTDLEAEVYYIGEIEVVKAAQWGLLDDLVGSEILDESLRTGVWFKLMLPADAFEPYVAGRVRIRKAQVPAGTA